MKAPKNVIDELNKVDETYVTPYSCMSYIKNNLEGYKNIHDWLYWENGLIARQVAIINHVYSDDKLDVEREPRYHVVVHNERLCMPTYYAFMQNDIYPYHEKQDYEDGFTKEFAQRVRSLVGGELEEISR